MKLASLVLISNRVNANRNDLHGHRLEPLRSGLVTVAVSLTGDALATGLQWNVTGTLLGAKALLLLKWTQRKSGFFSSTDRHGVFMWQLGRRQAPTWLRAHALQVTQQKDECDTGPGRCCSPAGRTSPGWSPGLLLCEQTGFPDHWRHLGGPPHHG